MKIQWIILILTSMSQFSYRVFVDYPSLLASEIKDYYDVDQFQINLLFSFRSFPNIVMPFVGGMLLDRFGTRRAMLGFCSFIWLGTFLCYLSVFFTCFPLMLVGRFIMGFFLESCYVGVYKIIAKWFKEAAFAYSVDTAFICGGTITSTILLTKLVTESGLQFTLLICLLFSTLSFIGLITVTFIDKVEKQQTQTQQFSFRLLLQFNKEFYIIVLSSIFCYTAYYVYSYNNAEMFKKIHHLTSYQAATLYGLPSYMAVFLAPYLGHLVDKYGYRMEGLQITSCCQLAVFGLLYMLPMCENTCIVIPAFTQLINGIFFAAYVVTLWPCISMVVESQLSGTAFGVVYSSISLGISFASIFIGKVVQQESYDSYQNMLLYLLLFGILGGVMNYLLYYKQIIKDNKNTQETELKLLD